MSSNNWDKVIFVLSIVILVFLVIIVIAERMCHNNDNLYNNNTPKKITKMYNNNNKNNVDTKINTIAKVLWCEDRGNRSGMRLVLSVIHNRASSKTIEGLYNEIIKPYQFECYSKLKKNGIVINDIKMYNYAKKLLINYRNGKFRPTTTAKYFYNPKLLNNRHPMWVKNRKLVAVYNGHWFYN